MTRPPCGSCPACLEATRQLLEAPPRECLQARRAPTAAELERHARRFGPEGVEQTATELGVKVAVARPTRRRTARGPTLKERVAGHLAAGRSVELIAELESLSPTRARRIARECAA